MHEDKEKILVWGSRCYLIDCDGTLVHGGTENFFEGALLKVNELFDQGNQIWLFTCRPPQGDWVQSFRDQGLKFHGVIHKPFAEEYLYFDDKLKWSHTAFV